METILHEDLWLQILVRLPVKSLVTFRCVSRYWYALITSSSFIAAHLVHSNESNSYRVLLRSFNREDKKVKYKLCHDNDNLDEIMVIYFPFVSPRNDFFRMVGCVNGLVCLSDDIVEQTNTLIIWNPVIRRFLTVAEPELDLESMNVIQSVFGFGFDPSTNDYKVIWILYHKDKGSEAYSVKATTAIFRLSTRSWEVDGSALVPLLDSRQAYVNGVIHWLAYNKLIVGFHVGSEDFKEIRLPDSLQNSLYNLTVAAWCGSLSIFENGNRSGRVSLWVMKDYGVQESWVRQLVVESSAVVRGLRRNGSVILQNGGKLVSYNSKTNQLEDFEFNVEGSLHGFHIKAYTESLVLLDRTDARLVLHSIEAAH